MEFFRDLDHFCKFCQTLKNRLDRLGRVRVSEIPEALTNVEKIRSDYKSVDAEYRRLDSNCSELRSQFFANEIREINSKFDQVERIYMQINKVANGRLEYLDEFNRVREALLLIEQELDRLEFEFQSRPQRTTNDLRDVCFAFVRLVADVQKLNQWPNEGITTILCENDEQIYSLNSDVERILRKAEQLWSMYHPDDDSLAQMIEEQRQSAKKEVELFRAYEEAHVDFQRAQALAREPSIEKQKERQQKLKRAEGILESKQDELARSVKLVDQLEAGSRASIAGLRKRHSIASNISIDSQKEPALKRLDRQWSELVTLTKREIYEVVSTIRRHQTITQTVDGVRPILRQASMVASSKSADLPEIEKTLETVLKKADELKFAQEESKGLPGHAHEVRHQLDQVEKEFSETREMLEQLKQEMLAQKAQSNELEEQLEELSSWIQLAIGQTEKLKTNTQLGDTDEFKRNLDQLQSDLDIHKNNGDQIARDVDTLQPKEGQAIRVRYLEMKSGLVKVEDTLHQMANLYAKLVDFEKWVTEFDGKAKAAPKLGSTAAEKWEVVNNLKWLHDYGLARELTCHSLKDNIMRSPALTNRIKRVITRYEAVLKYIKDELRMFEVKANTHDDFDRLVTKFNDTADWIRKDLDGAQLHDSQGYSWAKEKLNSLQKTSQDVKTLEDVFQKLRTLYLELKKDTSTRGIEGVDNDFAAADEKLRYLQKATEKFTQENAHTFQILDSSYRLADDLGKEIREIQVKVQRIIVPKGDLNEKTNSLEELKQVASQLEKMNPRFSKLQQEASNENDQGLNAKVKPLVIEYAALEKDIPILISKWQGYVAEHVKFDDILKQFLRTLSTAEDLEGKLKAEIENGNNTYGYEPQFVNVQRDLDSAKKLHYELTDLSRSVGGQSSRDGRDTMRSELRMLRDQLQSCQNELERLRTSSKELFREKLPSPKLTREPFVSDSSLAYRTRIPDRLRQSTEIESGIGESMDMDDVTSPISPKSTPYKSLSTIEEVSTFSSNYSTLKRMNEENEAEKHRQIELKLERKLEPFDKWFTEFRHQVDEAVSPKNVGRMDLDRRLNKIKSLQSQKPSGDRLLSTFVTLYQNSGLPLSLQDTWRTKVTTTKYQWRQTCQKLEDALQSLQLNHSDNKRFTELKAKALADLQEIERVIDEPSVCSNLQDKENRLAKIETMRPVVSRIGETLRIADNEKVYLAKSGMVQEESPTLDQLDTSLSKADRNLELEIKRWQDLVAIHVEYDNGLSRFHLWIDRKRGLVSELKRESMRSLTVIEDRIKQLEDIKSNGNYLVEQSSELIPFAQRNMLPEGQHKVIQQFDYTRKDWSSLRRMIDALIDSLMQQMDIVRRSSTGSTITTTPVNHEAAHQPPRRGWRMVDPDDMDHSLDACSVWSKKDTTPTGTISIDPRQSERSYVPTDPNPYAKYDSAPRSGVRNPKDFHSNNILNYNGEPQSFPRSKSQQIGLPSPVTPVYKLATEYQRPNDLSFEPRGAQTPYASTHGSYYPQTPIANISQSSPEDKYAKEFVYIQREGEPESGLKNPFAVFKRPKSATPNQSLQQPQSPRNLSGGNNFEPRVPLEVKNASFPENRQNDPYNKYRVTIGNKTELTTSRLSIIPQDEQFRQLDGYVTYGDVWYEDRFCRLKRDQLLVKTYYFPFFLPKNIKVPEIKAVFFAGSESDDGMKTPSWGCGAPFGTWWACNAGRGWGPGQFGNVVVRLGTGNNEARRGSFSAFSVRNMQAFLRILEYVLPNDVPMYATLP